MSARHPLIEAILAPEPAAKVGVLEDFASRASLADLQAAADALHEFAFEEGRNIYQRVRALFQIQALHRYLAPQRPELPPGGRLPREGHDLLLERRYTEAIASFRAAAREGGLTDGLSSGLAAAYHGLGFQILAGQVQRSVQSLRGNRWMFRTGHALDHPLRLRPELLDRPSDEAPFPVLEERTAVRMDLSHSGWSDIFFLGMDYPEGARVLNISVDLAVHRRDDAPRPPIRCSLRVIDEPVLRLTSVDLGATADITELAEVFDFARDYLGLLKAALIAAGVVPPGLEGSGQRLADVLAVLCGGKGRGLEVSSQVNDIPKGSRLAVSTNLLAGLIGLCMRATGQVSSLEGPLLEEERRIIAGRAILGEWLGGSGGGWQDSGGIWPGIKLIEGMPAGPDDVEHGLSRGRLLPRHTILDTDVVGADARRRLQESLVVVHGGMSQNVGPILEMVTEKFLLGTRREWDARQEALRIYREIVEALRRGDMRELGALTTRNFRGPIQAIIPWASNLYTERLIAEASRAFGERFWGFWMLGGMSGGGMGFIVDPAIQAEARERLLEIMSAAKRELQTALPFAMDPVVYSFAVNDAGSSARLLRSDEAVMSAEYYLLHLPRWLQGGTGQAGALRRRELERFASTHLSGASAERTGRALLQRLFPSSQGERRADGSLAALLERNGFDPEQHERIRGDLRAGRIGLAQNRLPADSQVEDVLEGDVVRALGSADASVRERGRRALAEGRVGVVTLAAGAGSRWTQGAGTVKALHPFARIHGEFRSFLDVHLSKTRRRGDEAGIQPLHVVTTSYLTHAPIEAALRRAGLAGDGSCVHLSEGRSIGLRLIPMARDLRFAWEQMPQQQLEERKQKVRDSGRRALLDWAVRTGEGTDYTDNLPSQCLHPVGHWYEVANLLRNGTLRRMLAARPQLETLMLHNIDTVGADLDPEFLGRHLESGATLTYEVINRRIDDKGGGLARVNGRVRLVEGLALPREEDEFKLTYYNTLTTWIRIDGLLALFGLDRAALSDEAKVLAGVRRLAARMPTYITLKEVKKRWGNAQEDVFPVAQFERLWGDMTALPDAACAFLVVPRMRGQQLKDQAQLDGWSRDGSREYLESLCAK